MEPILAMLYGGLFAFIGIITFVMGMPYSMFGLKVKLKRMRLKDNLGFMFLRNMSGSFSMPQIVDISKTKHDTKDGLRVFTREHFAGVKFFGVPSVIFDTEDMKNTVGFYYQDSNEKGEGLYNDDGSPKLTSIKPARTLEPDVAKAVIQGSALQQAIKDLFDKHRTQIYILGGIGLGIGIALYMINEMRTVDLVEVLNACRRVATTAVQGTTQNGGGVYIPN